VHPKRFVANSGARPGDVIYLTKPLGVGLITTAIKQNKVSDDIAAEAVRVMGILNRAAAEAMQQVGVHAATDVTGFGLLGHLHEMAAASGVGARVRASAVPVMAGAKALVSAGAVAGGTARNLEWLQDKVRWGTDVDEATRVVLADAQTSGGLLIAVAPERAATLEGALRSRGVEWVIRIGEMTAHERTTISVGG
jgi:selenide,water dikinase